MLLLPVFTLFYQKFHFASIVLIDRTAAMEVLQLTFQIMDTNHLHSGITQQVRNEILNIFFLTKHDPFFGDFRGYLQQYYDY